MESNTRRFEKTESAFSRTGIRQLALHYGCAEVGNPMPRTVSNVKGETFTFRLDPALKDGLARSAAAERVHPAELVRSLVRDHLAEKQRRDFEAEARRQSLAVARRAQDPASDEAQVMRDIDSGLEHDQAGGGWTA